MTQYSIRSKQSVIRAQAVYFLHLTMPSVMCLRVSDVIVICRVTYFQFPIQSALYRSPGSTSTIGFNTQYWTSDVAENVGRYFTIWSVQPKGKTLNLF